MTCDSVVDRQHRVRPQKIAMLAWACLVAALPLVSTVHATPQDPAATTPAAQAVAGPGQPSQPDQVAPDAKPAHTGCCLLVNGTVVDIEIAEHISSQRRKRGEKFVLRLAEPLALDGHTVLPAGTAGVGEIIHAASSGGGGKPGELLLAARYLEFDGRQIPLRGFRIGAAGKDRTQGAMAASMAVGPFAHFIHGREIEIPAGTRANAKLAADTLLPPTDAPSTTITTGTTQ